MIGLDSIVKHDPALFAADILEETVILSVEQGRYFSMTETSRAIWARLEKPTWVGELCRELSKEYDAPEADITRDTLAFLNYLFERGLIRLS
jgi:hypothetical protein